MTDLGERLAADLTASRERTLLLTDHAERVRATRFASV